MKNLTLFEASHNQISDISALAELTELQSIRISYNNITDITPLANLKNVTQLSIIGNDIKGEENLKTLMSMTNLISLTLGSGFSDEEIDELQKALPNCVILQF